MYLPVWIIWLATRKGARYGFDVPNPCQKKEKKKKEKEKEKMSHHISSCVTAWLKITLLENVWNLQVFKHINELNANVALILKPVNWSAQQINWLVSIWEQHWHLMG